MPIGKHYSEREGAMIAGFIVLYCRSLIGRGMVLLTKGIAFTFGELERANDG